VGRHVGPGALGARLGRRSLFSAPAACGDGEAAMGAGAARFACGPGARAEEAGEQVVKRGAVGFILNQRGGQRLAHAPAVGEAGRRHRAHRVERFGD
jgi:hypothetical protein